MIKDAFVTNFIFSGVDLDHPGACTPGVQDRFVADVVDRFPVNLPLHGIVEPLSSLLLLVVPAIGHEHWARAIFREFAQPCVNARLDDVDIDQLVTHVCGNHKPR